VLPDTFAALAAGRLDLTRPRAIAEATLDCPQAADPQVERALRGASPRSRDLVGGMRDLVPE
jgi:hypothetical protein